MHLTKHHGLGNDFLVLLDLEEEHPITEEMARAWCDRHTGIGADGLIGVTPGVDGADVTMTLRNADGGAAEMSGNGVRCLGQAVARARGVDHLDLLVATMAGPRVVQIRPGPDGDDTILAVEVDMGPVVEGSVPDLPWNGFVPERVAYVEVGNPHVVGLVDPAELAEVALGQLGPRVEHAVPGGVNLELIAVAAEGPDRLDLRVWERGAGLTLACGTGATAAAAVAHRWGLVGDRVEVRMPGGAVTVGVFDDEPGAHTTLAGPATFIADIEVPWR